MNNSSFKLLHFESLDSTSSYLKRNYNSLENLTIVSASFQTNGKGRGDRSWISSSDANLLFSLLLKEGDLTSSFPYLSICSALAVAKVLKEAKIKDVKIKWPNDVYVSNKKICGILLEGSIPTYLVIGIGLNVNQKEFPNDLRHPATSLINELNQQVDLEVLKDKVFKTLINEINKVLSGDYSFIKEVRELDYLSNKEVKAVINQKEELVRVLRINDDCSLRVEFNNSIYNLTTGEINFLNL